MVDEVEDPVGPAVDAATRTSLVAAGHVAVRLARERQEQANAWGEAAEQEARQLQQRWDAQRALARVEIEAADTRWLSQASAEQAAAVWQTAHVWAAVEPDAFGPSAERLRRDLQDRYGVDVLRGDSNESDLRAAADHEQMKARRADRERRVDEQSAATILASGGLDDEADEHREAAVDHRDEVNLRYGRADGLDARADRVGYDTEQRRAELAARIAGAGVGEDAAGGRVLAANANARAVRDATRPANASKKPSRGRKTTSRRRNQQLER